MPAPTLSISPLGPLRVTQRGTEVVLRPAQRRLLAVLLIDPGRWWRTDELIDRMWGDEPPPSARNALHVHLAGIRRALPGLVSSGPGGYRLADAGWRHDRAEFETTGARCLAAAARGSWAAAIAHANRAEDMWRGDPFPELADRSPDLPEVARLGELRMRVLEALAEAQLASGREDLAIAAAHRAIAADELRERPRALAMLALYRSAGQAAALREYQDYRRVLGESTGLEPGAGLRALEERMLLQDPDLGAVVATPPHNLPREITSFVGRDSELADLIADLASAVAVTVVGAPGSGKTRLAIEAARATLDRYPGGVWAMSLGGAGDEAALTATVTTTMGITEQTERVAALAAALANRSVLLVLDGCEGVLEPVRRLVAALAERPGACRVLATSRLPLGVPGETVLRLTGSLGSDDAVTLLADRVRTIDRGFTVTPENRPRLEELCRRLEGNPLALELVARWIPTLGVGDVARLLHLARTAGSLEAAFQWSRDLLAAEDRALLPRLTVFAAPFSLSRAHTVAGNDRSEASLAGSLSRLVEASLLAIDASPHTTRFRMLDPIREMAAASLTPAAARALRQRHAAAFVAAAPQIEAALRGPGQADMLATLDREMPEHRAALSHLRAGRRWDELAGLAPALVSYWYARFLGWEGRSWLEAIPRDRLTDAARSRVASAAGFLAWAVHDYDAADREYRECVRIAHERGDLPGTAAALYGLGMIHQKRRFEDGAAMLEDAAAIYRSLGGHELELGECLLFRGIDEALNGDPDRGESLLAEAAGLLERAAHVRQVSKAQRWRAHAAWRRHDESAAREHADLAEQLARRVGDQIALAGAQVEQANIAITWGNPATAAQHLVEALAPVPAEDEVDRSQVLQPIARLAFARGDTALAASLLAHIDDVYKRHGWRPLDDDPAARDLRRRLGETAPASGVDLGERVDRFLAEVAAS